MILENTTVNLDIEVVGSNTVTILPNSVLNRGLYTIDSYLNCYSFKKGSSVATNTGANINEGEEFLDENDMSESKVGDSKFTIYANPNNGQFSILFEEDEFEQYEIRIMDVRGQVVYFTSELGSSEYKMNIPIDKKGVFIIQIIDKLSHEIYNGKVIVQ